MEQNFSSSIPNLTLEPELEPVQELVTKEETALEEAAAPQTILSPEEQQMVDAFAAKIDVENTTQILQYGAGTQKKLAIFCCVPAPYWSTVAVSVMSIFSANSLTAACSAGESLLSSGFSTGMSSLTAWGAGASSTAAAALGSRVRLGM